MSLWISEYFVLEISRGQLRYNLSRTFHFLNYESTPMLEDAKDSLERIREGLAAKGESL